MTEKFSSLVSQYENQVYSLAYYLLADAAEAEDVVQDSFIKLWQHLEQLEDAVIGAWLMRVARNGSLDRLRKRKLQVAVEDQELTVDSRMQPEQVWERDSGRQRLMSIIHKLEEPWRSLVVLRDIHEHSYENVAEILTLSVNQVKVYLHRARKKLTELWHLEHSTAKEKTNI